MSSFVTSLPYCLCARTVHPNRCVLHVKDVNSVSCYVRSICWTIYAIMAYLTYIQKLYSKWSIWLFYLVAVVYEVAHLAAIHLAAIY